jgi:hypothetical protein
MSADHVVVSGRGGRMVFACLACDSTMSIAFPVEVTEAARHGKAFRARHVDCTREEKSRDPSKF